MVTGMFIAGGALIALTLWLAVRAFVHPRMSQRRHLRQIDQYGFHDESAADLLHGVEPSHTGPVNSLMEGVGRLTTSLVPRLPRLERRDLSAAGFHTVSADAVHGYRTTAALLLFGLVAMTGVSFSLSSIFLLIVVPGLAWELPGLLVRNRGRARLDAIDRELPHLIDVLIATIEAGMGFAASLQLLSDRFRGPLAAELKLMQREQGLGISNERALENFAERCDTPSIRSFSRSLLHGQEMGVSIGPILRNLALDIRRRRRQIAREKIQKAPVKMLIPLATLIFPPLLIVLLYPAVYNVLHSLSQ